MKTRGILLIIVALCLSMIAPSSLASDRDVHDAYMLKVLFGNDYKEENYNAKELAAIEALEAASYLAVDQYNGKGAEELKVLNNYQLLIIVCLLCLLISARLTSGVISITEGILTEDGWGRTTMLKDHIKMIKRIGI